MGTHDIVSAFYGREVEKTSDLIFDACCVADYTPSLLEPLTDEVKARRYGCGSPLPPLLEGTQVLDLGCGAGIDVFIAAQLVGERGHVVGVDMTSEQLEIARRNVLPIMRNIGCETPNVDFMEGKIESLPLEDGQIDVVISNCVINLSEDKEQVFSEIHRVLKHGGELFIADIVADRRIPAHLKADKRLYSECLSGAAYLTDLIRIMRDAGFSDARLVQCRSLSDVIEGIRFESVILRAFKLPLEEACEDYGQVAVYRGTIPNHSERLEFDLGHVFDAGRAVRVCKNTADMLLGSRFSEHFMVSPELGHLGTFDCVPAAAAQASTGPSCC